MLRFTLPFIQLSTMENDTHQDETIWAPGTVRLEDSKYDTTIQIQH